MLCFTVPSELVVLIDESLEFMDETFEVNGKACAHLGSSGLFSKVVKKFAISKVYYCGSNFNRFSYVSCQRSSFSCTDTNLHFFIFISCIGFAVII